ncbi:MAG TPA: hypothetical protein VF599_19505 [Pyrinomonadaceae bacterium]
MAIEIYRQNANGISRKTAGAAMQIKFTEPGKFTGNEKSNQ